MATEFLDKLTEAIVNPGELSEESRRFFRNTPGDEISRSRNMALRAALLNWDEEQILQLVKDASNIVGPEGAGFWFYKIWGDLVTHESPDEL